ncbi:hypothetical protein QTO34_014850 [Cnephaeus nilssonii]|uniref:Cystatin domain-containing protein n=1 Tax=Cnephaeus nilssonii TaxID=3371016 RepID=A0AA40I870_CNENI|nr:hypothetical protein QTO34_014850 [Eptesicus nilssonii]
MSDTGMVLGGCSAARPATDEIQAIADKVKAQLEEKENKKYPTFKATEYKSQVVAGTNYFIKVQVEDDDFVHIRVFQSLPHENKPLALHDYQTNKTKQDELTYFYDTGMVLGGYSAARPATAEIQAIADKVKAQLEEKENKKYPTFKATEYKSQLVQGTNYVIKVQVEDDDFVHIQVFESLPQENKPLALEHYQTNKTRKDELIPF